MDSNITIHIVEPGSTPIEPVVPNTGLFTSGIGGPEATILGIAAAVIILAVVIAILYYRNKKQGKFISLKHKKATTIGLASLAAVVSLGTVAGLLKLGASAADDSLTVTTSSTDFTIEVGDEPVFAVLPVELTVAEATQAGYTLTTYTEDTNLVSTTNPSDIIPMVTVEDELVALADNTYGLALVEPESQEDEVYAALSTDADTPTLITDKDYEATEAEDTTTIYYGFYITPDVPYGTYEGSNINYQANPNHITNLTFNGNGSDGGTAIKGMTLVAGDIITLPQNTYTREGYSFTGWNTVATPTTEDPGIAYADEAEFTASLIQSEDITLYAQWEEDVLYMQDVAKWGSSLAEGDTIEAVDNRDGKTYWVARLKDGHIWMTQNLDLDLSTGTELTPANTNITANWAPANTTISFTGTTVEGWQNNSNVPYSADPGELYIYSSGTTSNDDQYTSLADCQTAHPDCSAHNHAGNYYNWSAAVATNDTSSITAQYTNVGTDICPAGWRLPIVTGSNDVTTGSEWGSLLMAEDIIINPISGDYTTDGFDNIRKSPLWLHRSGYILSSLNVAGYGGYYWTNTVSSSYSAYYLGFYDEGVHPSSYNDRRSGFSVRCLAK